MVDKGKKRIKLEGLKLHEAAASPDRPPPPSGGVGVGGGTPVAEASLDAEFVDVYKGAHGVVFLFDVTKQWTFDYVRREIGKVRGRRIICLDLWLSGSTGGVDTVEVFGLHCFMWKEWAYRWFLPGKGLWSFVSFTLSTVNVWCRSGVSLQ